MLSIFQLGGSLDWSRANHHGGKVNVGESAFRSICAAIMSRPALKSTIDKAYESCRQGNHATIYEVRRDPKLANKNLIKDENSDKFPFISGAVYRGEWEKDQKSGFGTQTNSDGSKYEGDFKRNLYHGSGSLWVKKGKRSVKQYTGNWVNGKMSGFGSLFMDNGDIYKGEWVANKRSGEGRLDSPNGDYFIGQWIDNVQKGFGTMYLKNGNVFEGLYLDGIKDGPGRFFYAATKKVRTVILSKLLEFVTCLCMEINMSRNLSLNKPPP